MESKDIIARFGGPMLEEKARRVRTPAGAKRFGQPIGSIIVRDLPLTNIRILNPVYSGWDLVQDKRGKKYDVGKDDDGKWRAFGHGDWDDVVAEADNEDDLFAALDGKLGGSSRSSAKKPAAKKRPASRGSGGSGGSGKSDYDFLPDNLKTPEAQAHFDRIWKGEATGFSEVQLRRQLAEAEKLKEDFKAGRITARRIIGAGHRGERTLANEYIARQIAEAEEGLRTQGRSTSVNQSNVNRYLRSDGSSGSGSGGDKDKAPDASTPDALRQKISDARRNSGAEEVRKARAALADHYGVDPAKTKLAAVGNIREGDVLSVEGMLMRVTAVNTTPSGKVTVRLDDGSRFTRSPYERHAVAVPVSEGSGVTRQRRSSSGSSGKPGLADRSRLTDERRRTTEEEMQVALERAQERRDLVADEYRRAIRGARGAQRAGLITERNQRIEELDRRIQKILADIDKASGSGRGN